MTPELRWERRIVQHDDEVLSFVENFWADKKRRILLIAGAGFDQRATGVSEILASKVQSLEALLLREERPNADPKLRAQADGNLEAILKLVPNSTVLAVEIFAVDNAVIGGREAVKAAAKISIDDYTDVVVDYSALSRGVTFPIIRFLLERTQNSINVHVLVADEPITDEDILPVAWEQASSIHAFRGNLGPVSDFRPARLWLPQLIRRQNVALDLIYKMIQPHAYVRSCLFLHQTLGFLIA